MFVALAVILLISTAVLTASPDISNTVMTPGRTESELNFAWQTPAGTVASSAVQVALKPGTTGADFPEDTAETFTGKTGTFADGRISHKVSVGGLTPSTNYVYRLGTGLAGEWSETCGFSTRDSELYNILLVGDVQIGTKNIDDDTIGWMDTLNKALQKAPDAAFILSVGDQVESSDQDEYDGFLSLSQFKNLPFVPTIGNHDNKALFSYHFNTPNESSTLGKTSAGGNYYFTYGNSLFIVINSNSLNYGQHKIFIHDAVKKHSDARWKIVMMHHSIYVPDFPRFETRELRKNFIPIFDKYGIDVVLSGHDHIYVRTHFMRDDRIVQPLEKFPARSRPPAKIPAGAVIKPNGTLYLEAATSGSKYYDPASQYFDYIAERAAPYVPMFSRINITDTSFEIVTWKTDSTDPMDRFVMVKADAQGDLWIIFATGLICCAIAALIIWKRLR